MSNITGATDAYLCTIAHPNCIYNSVLAIEQGLANRPDANAHIHVMFEYDLNYVCPSTRFTFLIDNVLEDKGLQWRIHTYHVVPGTLSIRVIIRKYSLIDLTVESLKPLEHERALYNLMKLYSATYCDDGPIFGSSNVAIFKLPNTKGYFYIFTRVFDMWAYSDAQPERGWYPIEESDMHG